MRDQYYTAAEAAERLGLKYCTFLWRVKQGQYNFELFGKIRAFEKKTIDRLAEETKCS